MGDLVWLRIFFSQTSEDRRFPLTLIYNISQDIFRLQDFFPLEISLQDIFFPDITHSPPHKSNGRPLRQH